MAETETLSPALPEDVERLAREVLERACAAELTLATAESCTGGLLASLLTDVEGCSHAFERGLVAYSHEAKRELLGVSAALLENEGAVSEAAARAMAEGLIARSRADLGLSVTGFAGPGAPGQTPGLVYLALARRDGPLAVRREVFSPSDRGSVRIASLRAALQMFRQALP